MRSNIGSADYGTGQGWDSGFLRAGSGEAQRTQLDAAAPRAHDGRGEHELGRLRHHLAVEQALQVTSCKLQAENSTC